MGGTDEPENLVELTPAEHAEAHRVLYEEHNRHEDYCAWKGLSGEWDEHQRRHELARLGGITRMRKHPNPMKNPEVAKRANNHPDRVIWNKGKKTGQVPWNKGQTKETDSRITNTSSLEVASRKIACDCGCGKPYNPGNLAQHKNKLRR